MLFKSENLKEKIKENVIFKFFTKLSTLQFLLGLLFSFILFAIVVTSIAPNKISVEIGDVSPVDIIASKDIVDEITTKKLVDEAIKNVKPRYIYDLSVQVKVKNEIKNLFQSIISVKDDESKDLKSLLNLLNNSLTENDYTILIESDINNINKLEFFINDIVDQLMSVRLAEEELSIERDNVSKIFEELDLSKDLKEVGTKIINNSIKPNQVLDVETIEQKRKEAANGILPVIVKEGELIARKGEKINDIKLELIKKTGVYKEKDKIDYKLIIGSLLFVLILVLVISIYLYYLNREVFNNLKELTLLFIIIVSTILMSKGLYGISEYIIPISAASMLISILINPKLSIVVNFIISILVGFITGSDISIVTLYLISGTIGAISVVKTHQRHNIFFAGVLISISNVLIITSFSLIGSVDAKTMVFNILYGLLNGVFSAILTIGSLPLWEGMFGILTQMKLLELANPNHPLFKKLLLEAPGTYHHSVIVANLSESAAEAVNGNPLIARVGAYYHDVGKLKRPYLFKENQFNIPNPHDKIKPSLSTFIIINHVKDGVSTIKEYKLPLVIENIVREHHGTTLVKYFYHKALNGENPDLIKEESFRYLGPKPQTKEAAIVMLADSVEAAVRTIPEPTKGKIEGLVRTIIKGKLTDGQLDECDLTLKDLDVIANSFLNILLGIFHERIEYPKLDLNELKGVN